MTRFSEGKLGRYVEIGVALLCFGDSFLNRI